MENTPSALKWLAEKRARIAGELQSCEQSLAYLEGDLPAWRGRLETAERALIHAGSRKERLMKELASLDLVVQLYLPSAVKPRPSGWRIALQVQCTRRELRPTGPHG
jgi:hypothetical protein